MGKTFFMSWALWEKLSFILACLLVLTFFSGLIKLWWDTRKLKKYTKVATKKAKSPEVVEAQQHLNADEEKVAIPFGIRAIESGIEVDGVWISRGNTPVPGSPASSASTWNGGVRGRSNVPHLDITQPQPVVGSTSRASSQPSLAFERAVDAERVVSDRRDPSPGPSSPMDAARRRMPLAYNRYSNHSMLRNPAALDVLEGDDSRRDAPSSLGVSHNPSTDSSRKSSSGSESELDDLHPALREPVSSIRTLGTGELDLLQSHRLSHVAETGQLTPRTRKPAHSGEWASVADRPDHVDYFTARRGSPSPPTPEGPLRGDPFQTPGASGGTTPVGYDNQNAIPLLQVSQHRTPPATESTYDSPQSALHARSAYGDSEYFSSQISSSQDHNAVSAEQNQRNSQVVRKANSGFQVLKPGTFADVPSVDEEEDGRQPRKLQKKRRQSDASSTHKHTTFTERV